MILLYRRTGIEFYFKGAVRYIKKIIILHIAMVLMYEHAPIQYYNVLIYIDYTDQHEVN